MIREAKEEDFGEWLRMRVLLHPDHIREDLLAEIEKSVKLTNRSAVNAS